jgi:hypothetical protein
MTGLLTGIVTVVVKTREGKEATGWANFVPQQDYEIVEEEKKVQGYCCGNHADWTFFDYELTNDWGVISTVLKTRLGWGHCDLVSSPYEYSKYAKVRVHVGVSGFDPERCIVTQIRKGPKGMPTH